MSWAALEMVTLDVSFGGFPGWVLAGGQGAAFE